MPAWALEAGSRPELSGRWRSEVLDTQVDAVDQEGGWALGGHLSDPGTGTAGEGGNEAP